MGYNPTPSSVRRGQRATTTVNPMDVIIDVDDVLSRAPKAEAAFANLLKHIQKGKNNPTAKQSKIYMRQDFDFETYDQVTGVQIGTAGESRLARLTVACRNVINTTNNFFYRVGDELYLSNGQTVEVVMTPDEKSNAIATLTTGLTGNTTTRSAPGTIVVRNVEKAPFTPFPTGSVGGLHWGGKSVAEGERVNSAPIQSDVFYDCNFVETFETTMEVTETELKYFQSRQQGGDYKFQQEKQLQRIHAMRDLRMFFGTRAAETVNIDGKSALKYRMGGLNYFVRTNVMAWNPLAVTDPEKIFNTWMVEHLFRHVPNDNYKVVFIGERLHAKWMEFYRDYRRIDMKAGGELRAMGIDFETYTFGTRKIQLIPYRHFGVGTEWEWWAFGVDLPSLQYYERFGATTRDYTQPGERVKKIALEMACTMAVRNEPAHAILRPF